MISWKPLTQGPNKAVFNGFLGTIQYNDEFYQTMLKYLTNLLDIYT